MAVHSSIYAMNKRAPRISYNINSSKSILYCCDLLVFKFVIVLCESVRKYVVHVSTCRAFSILLECVGTNLLEEALEELLSLSRRVFVDVKIV